jgi:hypothetical protein
MDGGAEELADLPPEIIRLICGCLPSKDLARLCLVYRTAFLCSDKPFRFERMRAAGLQANSGSSLQAVALHECLLGSLPLLHSEASIGQEYSTQIGFEFGGTLLDDEDGTESGVPCSQGRLAVMGNALRLHPSATAVIEAHVGPTAPRSIAISYSISRAANVAAALVWDHNIAVSRLRVRAWGKLLTKRAAKSAHPNGDAARAGYGWGEVFLMVDGLELPRRPDYYRAGIECGRDLSGAALAAKLTQPRRPRPGRLIAPARLPAPAGHVATGNSSEARRSAARVTETSTGEASTSEVISDDASKSGDASEASGNEESDSEESDGEESDNEESGTEESASHGLNDDEL